ncbi:hypothetical protein HMSSN036_41730 [Paenibacillus macerans]|nr:hypothetical protein HMSSN036_41730 [Paenibacillus macerans]
MLPLLTEAPAAELEQDGQTWPRLAVSDEPLPLQFELGEAGDNHFHFAVRGLDDCIVFGRLRGSF